MSEIQAVEIRAGALRRLGALLVDVLAASLVLVILVFLLNAALRYVAINLTIWLRSEWLVALLGFAYSVTLETRFGVTLGKRLFNIRVVHVETLAEPGISLGKALSRNFLIWPTVALFPRSTIAGFILLPGITLGVGTLVDIYCLWILMDVFARKDPIYDRLAGTAVLERLRLPLFKGEGRPHGDG